MSVTAANGFRAAGVAAGLKPSGRPDMALVVNDGTGAIAGVFTTNRVKAAPVVYTQHVVAGGTVRAVVLNSGGANACTGTTASSPIFNLRRPSDARSTAPDGLTWWNASDQPLSSQYSTNDFATDRHDSASPTGSPNATAVDPTRRYVRNARPSSAMKRSLSSSK